MYLKISHFLLFLPFLATSQCNQFSFIKTTLYDYNQVDPAFGSITIASDIDYKTNIIDINGQSLKSIKLNAGINLISINELQAGVYFIYDGRQSYKKLIVY